MSRTAFVAVGLALVGACSLPALWFLRPEPVRVTDRDVQCGHWCVVRCAELLGVPLAIEDVLRLMPPAAQGHSLQQVSTALETIGLTATGRQERFESLAKRQGPWIVHLKDPDHFIVLVSIKDRERRIHAFDPLGNRETISLDSVRTRWSGKLLEVRRGDLQRPLPLSRTRPAEAPCIQFQSLFLDKGSVYSNGQLLPFHFEFQNLGDKPLVIESVHPSCSCLIVDAPSTPIPSRQTGVISVTVNPGATGGPFLHSLDVRTNDPVLSRVRLQASGYVATDVQINPPRIDLGSLPPGTTVQRQCFLRYHNKDTHLRLSDLKLPLDGAKVEWIEHVDNADSIARLWPDARSQVDLPEGVSVIQVAYTVPSDANGPVSATLEACSNIRGYERIQIPVSGTVLRPILFVPSILSFGEVGPETDPVARIRLRRAKGTSFQILTAEIPGLAALDWKAEPLAGGVQELQVRLSSQDALRVNGQMLKVQVRLDGEDNPVTCECPVFAASRP